MTSSPDRQTTREELLVHAMSLGRRLSSALDRWDSGDPDAIADVAARARTLLCYGKGDKVILRLARAYSVELPGVRVHGHVDVEGPVEISIGGTPLDPWDEGADAIDLSFENWLQRDVAVLPAARRRRTSWAQFVTDYGNAVGAHAGETVPHVLELVTLAGGPNGHLGGYLLRAAAVVAERVLWAVLHGIGEDLLEPARSVHPSGVVVTGISIGRGPNAWHAFGFRVDDSCDREILSFPMSDGTTLQARWRWDAATESGTTVIDVVPEAPQPRSLLRS